MSEAGGSHHASEATEHTTCATAFELFKHTVVADMHDKFAAGQASPTGAADWRQGLSPQVLDAAVLKMWTDANLATKTFFQHVAERKNECEREGGASSGEHGQAAVPNGEEEDNPSGEESDHDNDDGGSSKPTTRAGPTAKGGSPSRQDMTDARTLSKITDTGRRHRGGSANINATSTGHHALNHTNNGDAISRDGDGHGDGDTRRGSPMAMVTKSRASAEAQAKDPGRPEKKQKASKSTPDMAAVMMVRRLRASDEAQAKNTGRSEEKQKARKSTPDEVSRDDDNNNPNSPRPRDRSVSTPPVPTMPRKSLDSVQPRAEAKELKASSSIPVLDVMDGVVSASESVAAPTRNRGDATELVPTAKIPTHNRRQRVVKPTLAATREDDDEQGGGEGGRPEAKKARSNLLAAGETPSATPSATPKLAKEKTQQPPQPLLCDPLVPQNPVPGNPDHRKLLPDPMMPAITLPSAASVHGAKGGEGTKSNAPTKRGRGRRRRAAPPSPGNTSTARTGPPPTSSVPGATKDGSNAESCAPPKRGRGRPRKAAPSPGNTSIAQTGPPSASSVPGANDCSNAESGAPPTKRGRGRPRKIAPSLGEASVARRVEGQERLLDGATIPTRNRYGGENGDHAQTATATLAPEEANTSERDSRNNKPTAGGMASAGKECNKPSRSSSRPPMSTGRPAETSAPDMFASQIIGGFADEDGSGTPSVPVESALHEKESSATSMISKPHHAVRNESGNLQQVSRITKVSASRGTTNNMEAKPAAQKGHRGSTGTVPAPPVSASTSTGTADHHSGNNVVGWLPPTITERSAKRKSGERSNMVESAEGELSVARGEVRRTIGTAGKPVKGGDGTEVTRTDEGGGGVTDSAVFGVSRQKAAVIEVCWEVDVQTVGRNTEKKWPWFTAFVDLTEPCGVDDEGRMEWKTAYARTGGLAGQKSNIVFLSKDTLRDALQGYMEGPLQWREKGIEVDLPVV